MKHECGRDFSRAWRLVLSGLELDDHAWGIVIAELGNCPRCTEHVMRQLVSLFCGRLALASRSLENATDVAIQAISEELMP
jgi:hypothetical protein